MMHRILQNKKINNKERRGGILLCSTEQYICGGKKLGGKMLTHKLWVWWMTHICPPLTAICSTAFSIIGNESRLSLIWLKPVKSVVRNDFSSATMKDGQNRGLSPSTFTIALIKLPSTTLEWAGSRGAQRDPFTEGSIDGLNEWGTAYDCRVIVCWPVSDSSSALWSVAYIKHLHICSPTAFLWTYKTCATVNLKGLRVWNWRLLSWPETKEQ